MKHPLTDEQTAAVEAQAPRFTVKASAGAGKTLVLVSRYLRHVTLGGLRPDQILTITFTRKAAAEMKRRIVDELRLLGRDEDAQTAETGPIQTIHGFCERALRENSLAAGVDPEFEILSQGQSNLMVERIVLEALSQDHAEQPLVAQLIRDLAGRFDYGAPVTLQSKLVSSIQSVLGALRGSGHSPDELEPLYASAEALRSAIDRAILKAVPASVREALEQREGHLDHEPLSPAFRAAKAKTPDWASGFSSDAEPESSEHTCGLVQLALYAWRRIEGEMDRAQEFDFTYLESRAVRLLAEQPAVREKLRRQYPVVLVDESQDVNPVQYRLLDSLSSDHEMMVGDVKQSIYGFRQAEPRLFQSRTSELPCYPLSANFRSAPGILRFVDDVFGNLWGAEYQPMSPKDPDDPFGGRLPGGYEGVEIWPLKAKDTFAVATWIFELVEGERVPKRDVCVLVRSAAYAADLADKLGRLGVEHRIAGGSEKYYSRLVVRDLANALQALSDPTDDFALLALLRSPIVDLSLDAVVLAARSSPVASALRTLQSPIEGDDQKMADFRRWFEPLSASADRLSAWEVLGKLFQETDYLVRLARREDAQQALANARKLLYLATQQPESSPLQFAEHIRQIQQIRHQEGDAPATDDDADLVTIMTIHKAKGLEFPVVVVPDTHSRLVFNAPDVVCDMGSGLVATKFGAKRSLGHRWLSETRRQREREEAHRLLYVALTRAKERLCLCIHNEATDQNAAGLLARQIGFAGEGLNGARIRGRSGGKDQRG